MKNKNRNVSVFLKIIKKINGYSDYLYERINKLISSTDSIDPYRNLISEQ